MAVVASGRQRIVRLVKAASVLPIDDGLELFQRLGDHSRNRVLRRHRRVFVGWMEFHHVVEALSESRSRCPDPRNEHLAQAKAALRSRIASEHDRELEENRADARSGK